MISLVVPAYNEEDRIELALILSITTEAEEIIVVADGQDKTAEIVDRLIPIYRKVHGRTLKLVKSEKRLGKGGAFLEGVKAAIGDQVFLVDADFPVPTRYVRLFRDLLQEFDCVIGSRYSPASEIIGQPFSRRVLSLGYRRFVNWLFDLGLNDYQCGFKAFRRNALDQILPLMQCRGFAFDVELLIRLSRAGCTIAQCPVRWEYGRESKVSWRQVIGMFCELLRIRSVTNSLRNKMVETSTTQKSD